MITSDDLFTKEFNVEPLEVFEENDEQNPDAEDGVRREDEAEEVSTVVKPKRIVRNPQPKLNEERLKGPKGLSAIEKHFEKVKYKGKGYEEQDLNTILKMYEYWCHRMFPKFPFDESIAKIEKLGSKKTVQNHIKRMRLGIELEDIERQTHVNVEDQPRDEFDDLLGAIQNDEPEEISEEQLERMRLNRERAEKLKQERLGKARGMAQICLEEPSSIQDTLGTSHQRIRSESSSSEEDIDMIFHKLNPSKESKISNDLDSGKEFSNPGTSKNASSHDNAEEEDPDTIFDKLSSSRGKKGGHDLDERFSHSISQVSEEDFGTVFDELNSNKNNKESSSSNMEHVKGPSDFAHSVQTNFHDSSEEDEEDIDTIFERLNSNKENKPQNEDMPDSDGKEDAGESSGEDVADEILLNID